MIDVLLMVALAALSIALIYVFRSRSASTTSSTSHSGVELRALINRNGRLETCILRVVGTDGNLAGFPANLPVHARYLKRGDDEYIFVRSHRYEVGSPITMNGNTAVIICHPDDFSSIAERATQLREALGPPPSSRDI